MLQDPKLKTMEFSTRNDITDLFHHSLEELTPPTYCHLEVAYLFLNPPK